MKNHIHHDHAGAHGKQPPLPLSVRIIFVAVIISNIFAAVAFWKLVS